jgi:hypothetical protein
VRARITRYTSSGDTQAILEPAAARDAEQLLALVPDPGQDIDVCYAVGCLYWCRWVEQGNGQDTPDFQRTIDLMIHVHRDEPDLVPRMLADMFDRTGHTTGALRAGAASNEGNRLFEEHGRTGDRATLEEAIALLRQAAHSPDTDPDRQLGNAMAFSLALHQAVQLDGDPRVADELIDWLDDVLADEPPDPADFLGLLVSALTYRFGATRDPADLDDAVTTGRRLSAVTQKPLHRGTVCMAGGLWLQHNGNSPQAGEIAELALACLASAPAGHPNRLYYLGEILPGLATVIDLDPALVDRAIGLYREFCGTQGADQVSGRRGLLVMVRRRYQSRLEPSDLDECVNLGRWVLDALPHDDPARWDQTDALSTDLGHRFRATDHLADLDEAIALGRQLVGAVPEARYVNNLAAWLADRCQLTGDMATLEEAVGLLRRAVATTRGDALLLRNLAAVLELKHHRTGEFAALDEARALTRRAAGL